MDRVVLLFLHGGSYTKECWDPIIRRIKQSPLLQRVPCETVAFDWRFHGEKSDHSVGATISYVHGNKAKPRSDHPLRVWVEWGLDDLRDVVKKLRDDDKDGVKTKIVAIGHSMGASAMLQVEMENPGTFQGIIAFEPVHGKSRDEANAVTDMLVSVTLRRPGEWDTWEDVVKHFKTGKTYRRWNAESMDAFLKHGVRKRGGGKYVLATTPQQEAAIYCHQLLQFDFPRVSCPVTIEHAEKSHFFDAKSTKLIAQQYPDKYTMADAIRNTTHSMIVEDPESCAAHIVQDLERLPCFQPCAKL